MSNTLDYQKSYAQWLEDPAILEEDKAELRSIAGDDKEIQDRFYRELSFGTAGLRGVIGIGSNRMNRYTVGRATQGYADSLNKNPESSKRGVVIAYDSRRFSKEFALESALVLAGNGIKTYLFPEMRAVPQLSFAIGHLNCIGGIVITASHNPAQYNGYKVYGENGAQIGPDIADSITAAIAAVPSFSSIRKADHNDALGQGLLVMLDSQVDDAYFSYTEALCLDKALWKTCSDMPVVYTPLHGTGALAVPKILQDMGLTALYPVEEQMKPDPNFSTVTAPNPEVPDALNLAKKLATEKNAVLVLATDPDADRLGVAVRAADGSFVSLTGNQIGALLFDYIVTQKKASGTLAENSLLVRSLVTGHLVDSIAKENNIAMHEVLTGFRFIGEIVAETTASGQETFLFGFEESFGYLYGHKVRDKDAICASMLLCECALYHNQSGKTLLDALEDIFQRFGYYVEDVYSYTLYGIEGMEKIRAGMQALRDTPPTSLAGVPVAAKRDYLSQERVDLATGEHSPIALPASDIVYFELSNGAWVCVRPSGTEPKLKLYVNSLASARSEANEQAAAILRDLRAQLDPILS